MTAPAELLDWWQRGEQQLGTALGRVTDEEFAAPSRLPGWSRAQLLAHVARNADALVNLLTWARTGVETPMYPGPGAREEQIARTADQPPAQLREDLITATRRLAAAVRELPDAAWSAEVRTPDGHAVPASMVPWLRSREVWVHAVDLDSGTSFADVPDDCSPRWPTTCSGRGTPVTGCPTSPSSPGTGSGAPGRWRWRARCRTSSPG